MGYLTLLYAHNSCAIIYNLKKIYHNNIKWYVVVESHTDGLSTSNSAACGGLFRNYRGFVCGVFVQWLGEETTYFAEFSAVIIAVEIAFAQGWNRIWFEIDSSITLLNFFRPDYVPPWRLRRRWERCLELLKGMEFRASHIYKEGNVPVDVLSNMALAYDDFTWWGYEIPEIRGAILANRLGLPMYRFCWCFVLNSFGCIWSRF